LQPEHAPRDSLEDHLAVGRARDLNAAVFEARHGPGTLPGRVIADVLGLLEEVGEGAGVVLGLLEDAAVQESLAGRVEGAVQDGEELERGRSEDLLVTACGWLSFTRVRFSQCSSSPRRKPGGRRKDAERSGKWGRRKAAKAHLRLCLLRMHPGVKEKGGHESVQSNASAGVDWRDPEGL
jgi:hypothetical protein